MSRKITLQEWASRTFEKPPTPKTLRRWASDCWIFPIPQKVGRAYYVQQDARFIGRDHSRIGNGSEAA